MRILATTLALACFAAPTVARAQQVAGPTFRAVPMALPRVSASPATRTARSNRALEGAVVGFVVGTTATIVLTRSGGSTSLCNSSKNQDALSSSECLGLAVAGGLIGAGVGALIGSGIRVSALQTLPSSPYHHGYGGSRLVIAKVSIGRAV